jgi:uncharacterized protein YndB with AHSA1/START domain
MPSYYKKMSILRRSVFWGGMAVALSLPTLSRADVADAAANGFTVKLAVTIRAAPQDVYRRLVHNVGDWWDPAHTFSGDAHNLTIEDKPMGCFCEKLPGGGGVRHLEVVQADTDKVLVLVGGLGPLQSMAVTGSMTIQLAPVRDDGTRVAVVYTVSGYSPAGMNALAAPVDTVLTEQFMRLKRFVEFGKAAVE